MLHFLLSENFDSLLAPAGIIFAFVVTVFAISRLADRLPKDAGRAFAHNGKLSAGKPRGAGVIFVPAFVLAALLFAHLTPELVIYLILTLLCMLMGYLDDASKIPWGEYKKGFLDLCVAALVAMTYLKYNPNTIELALFHVQLTLPTWLFAILIVVLVWGSVNVTNCADGVDGLSGTLTIISIMTIYIVDRLLERGEGSDPAFCGQYTGLSVVQRRPQPSDYGGCGKPGDGAVYQCRHPEDRLPAALYSHCAGAYPGRRSGSAEGGSAALFENPNSQEYQNAPSRSREEGLGLVEYPDGFQICHYTGYSGGGGGIWDFHVSGFFEEAG